MISNIYYRIVFFLLANGDQKHFFKIWDNNFYSLSCVSLQYICVFSYGLMPSRWSEIHYTYRLFLLKNYPEFFIDFFEGTGFKTTRCVYRTHTFMHLSHKKQSAILSKIKRRFILKNRDLIPYKEEGPLR